MSCLKLHCFKSHFLNVELASFSKLVHKNGVYFVSTRRSQPKLAFNSSFNFKCKSTGSFCVAKDTVRSSEGTGGGEDGEDLELEYLAPGGEVYKKTLRLVESAMFAGVSGLAYILSNSLSVEVES